MHLISIFNHIKIFNQTDIFELNDSEDAKYVDSLKHDNNNSSNEKKKSLNVT